MPLGVAGVAHTDDGKTNGVSRLETENRLLFSLLKPVVRFARRCRFPLDRFVELLTLAYFKDLRDNGLTVKEAATLLDKSVRTVTAISQRVKDDFFAPEAEHGLPRRLEFLLSQGTQTLGELNDAVASWASDDGAVEAALQSLIRDGRVVEERTLDGERRFRVSSSYADLNLDSWQRRIDALNHLGEAMLDTVIARLQQNDDDAFARVFTFGARPERLAELRETVYQTLRGGTLQLEDDAALEGRSRERYHIVFCVSPVVPDTDLDPSGAARRSRKPRSS